MRAMVNVYKLDFITSARRMCVGRVSSLINNGHIGVSVTLWGWMVSLSTDSLLFCQHCVLVVLCRRVCTDVSRHSTCVSCQELDYLFKGIINLQYKQIICILIQIPIPQRAVFSRTCNRYFRGCSGFLVSVVLCSSDLFCTDLILYEVLFDLHASG